MSSARQLARQAAASAFYASGGFRRATKRRASQGQVCILGLHRVLSEPEIQQSCSEPAIVLKETTFRDFCAFLAAHFEVVSLSALLAGAAACGRAMPRCVITFDDGWEDNYSRALPILRQFGFPATIFLATAMLDSNSTFWVERVRAYAADPERRESLRRRISPRLKKSPQEITVPDVTEHLKHMSSEQRDELIAELIGELPEAGASDRMLSWEQVGRMSQAGVEFAGHSHTHPLLPFESAEKARWELRVSGQKLQEHGTSAPCGFAYPNGSWNEEVRSLVKQAGYTCAATTRPGWFAPADDVYSMRRVLLHEGNVSGPDGGFSASATALTMMGWR